MQEPSPLVRSDSPPQNDSLRAWASPRESPISAHGGDKGIKTVLPRKQRCTIARKKEMEKESVRKGLRGPRKHGSKGTKMTPANGVATGLS